MSNQTDSTPDESGPDQASGPQEGFPSAWVAGMLEVADRSLDARAKVRLLKGCAAAHYRSARMPETVAPFAGDLERFLEHLSQSWNWKISYDPSAGIILADENKSSCVCPLARGGARLSPLLCHCSEGFAERMFSAVTGKAARATVIRSVLRGDPSCVYRIELGEESNGQARRDRAGEGRRESEARGA